MTLFGRALLFTAVALLVYPDLLMVSQQSHQSFTMVKAYSQGDVYSLMDELFTGYRPEVRPTQNGSATKVFISMYLLSIQGLDERSQVLETSIILDATWTDEWLTWNETEFGNITHFLFPQNKVWLPDLVIGNSVESHSQLGYNTNLVLIGSEGFVEWHPSEVIKTGCDIDVTYYPFDTQTCTIIISTWMSTIEDINIDARNGQVGLNLNRYSDSGTWELISNTMQELPDENGLSRIQFKMKMQRLRTYYVLNIILPVLFLSSTASLVFFLPAEAGEKIGMGITVLLAYAVYLTIISDNMPQTSLQVSYLSVYLNLLLGFTAFGVILSVIVLHIHHKSEDVEIGTRTKAITRKLRKLLFLYKAKLKSDKKLSLTKLVPPLDTRQESQIFSRPQSKVAPASEMSLTEQDRQVSPPPSYMHDEAEEEITWIKVAETLDRVMFLLTSCLIALFTLIFLPILAAGA